MFIKFYSMKGIFYRLLFVLVTLATSVCYAIAQVDTSVSYPPVSASHPSFAAWVGAVAVSYELIVRLIPTSKTLTIIGNVLKFALFISNKFDKGVTVKK